MMILDSIRFHYDAKWSFFIKKKT